MNQAPDGTEANGDVVSAHLSDAGHQIEFASPATDLAPGDHNGVDDVFVHGALAPGV
jgi:hypothetical protein